MQEHHLISVRWWRNIGAGVHPEELLCQAWKSMMQLTETWLRPGFICKIPSLNNAAGDQVLVCMQFIAALDLYSVFFFPSTLPRSISSYEHTLKYCTVYTVLIDVWFMLDSNMHWPQENLTCYVHVLVHWTNCTGVTTSEWWAGRCTVCSSILVGNVFSRDSSHRFVPVCFPALLLVAAAAAPELHCAGCFFLGTGAFALPLKALVGSSLFRCTSPGVSDEPTSLLNISGWYSEAHCCGGKRHTLLPLMWIKKQLIIMSDVGCNNVDFLSSIFVFCASWICGWKHCGFYRNMTELPLLNVIHNYDGEFDSFICMHL